MPPLRPKHANWRNLLRSSHSGRRVGRVAAALVLPIVLTFNVLPVLAEPSPSSSEVVPDRQSSTTQNGVALLRIVVPDQTRVDGLNSMGVDLAEYKKEVDGGIEVHAVLSPQEAQDLRDLGFDVRGAISDQTDLAENKAERQAAQSGRRGRGEADKLTPLRAEWFDSTDNQRFLSVEVKSSATDARDRAHRHLGQRPQDRPGLRWHGDDVAVHRRRPVHVPPVQLAADRRRDPHHGHDHEQPRHLDHGSGDQVAG